MLGDINNAVSETLKGNYVEVNSIHTLSQEACRFCRSSARS